MFDFGAHGRDEGGVKGRNNKGLVTFDRKLKKDAFYLYKAYWSKDPFVYIAGRRYVNRAEKETEITVYSNKPQVELYQNGRLTGTQTASYVFRFQVTMEPENVILVKAGEKRDSVILYKVEKPDPSYILPVQGEVENWFNDLAEIKEGYFSLEDKVGDLVESPEGLQIFRDWGIPIPGTRQIPLSTPRFPLCSRCPGRETSTLPAQTDGGRSIWTFPMKAMKSYMTCCSTRRRTGRKP